MTQALSSIPEPLTFEAYRFWQAPDDRRYELFRGCLIPMNPPTPLHVSICQFLVYQFQQYFVRQGIELVARSETGVRTEDASSRIPDVTVCSQTLWETLLSRPGSGILDFAQAEIPQLVVEVVSTNWKDDYIRKRAEYAAIGIPEYWLVDPQRQHVWVLNDPESLNTYEQTEYGPDSQLESIAFPGFVLAVEDILNPPSVEDLMRQTQAEQRSLQSRSERMAARLRELGIDPDTV